MNKKIVAKTAVLLIALFLGTALGWAQSENGAASKDGSTQDTLRLSEAVAKALQNNHNIQIARNQVQIDKNNATWGNAGLLPELSLNGSANRSRNNTQQVYAGNQPDNNTDGAVSETYNASLDMQYTLFDGFGNYYRFQSLENLKDLSGVQSRLDIENTLVQLLQQYLNVIALSRETEIDREAMEISKDRYERVRSQYQMGGRNKVSVLNAEVALNQDSVRYFQNISELNKAKHELQVLLGEEPRQDVTVQQSINLAETLTLPEIMQSAVNENASLVAADLQMRQSELSLKQNTARRYPQLNANASYSYNRSENDASFIEFQETDGLSAGLSLRFNIFNGFQQNIDVQNAKIRLKNSEQQKELTRKQVRKEVLNTYEDYENSLFLLDKQEVRVETARLNFRRTEEQFNQGQVTNSEFREAQLNLLQARLEMVNMKVNAKLSEIRLQQLAGKLIEKKSP